VSQPAKSKEKSKMPSQLHSQLQLKLRLPILLLLLLAAATAERPQPGTLEGCPDKCGDTSIPFPFGMTPGCFRPGFQVVCNHSFVPPRAFLHGTNQNHTTMVLNLTAGISIISREAWRREVELMDVSVEKSEARVYAAVNSACTRNDTYLVAKVQLTELGKEGEGPFLLSAARNVLVGVGASVVAIMRNSSGETTPYTPSCLSDLMGNLQYATNGSCTGLGCCVGLVPRGAPPITSFGVGFTSRRNKSTLERQTTPCTYGMVVESSRYTFSTPDLYGYEGLSGRLHRGVPVAIDFAIRDPASSSYCPAQGQQPPPDYACVSGNSSCSSAANGGYVCKCWDNYQGNPYIANGCQGSRARAS
jgi:hypothetical protein